MAQTNHESSFPIEIIELIIQEIGFTKDITSLRSTALASRTLLHVSRIHLFRKVFIPFASERDFATTKVGQTKATLDRPKFLAFSSFLLRIADYIRVLVLENWGDASDSKVQCYTASSCLVPILKKLKFLQAMEVYSIQDMIWSTFDRKIKNAIIALFKRPGGASMALSLSWIMDVGDRDFTDIISSCTNVTLSGVQFNDLRRIPSSRSTLLPIHSATSNLTLKSMDMIDFYNMVTHYPEFTAGLRRLAFHSTPDIYEISTSSGLLKAAENTLTHLEWGLGEVSVHWDDNHKTFLEQVDLRIFLALRSIAIRIPVKDGLRYSIAILASAAPGSHIESVGLTMQTTANIRSVFAPSDEWGRLDEVLGGIGYPILHEIELKFYGRRHINTSLMKALDLAFVSFQRNLARSKDRSFKLTIRDE